jgi:hypothetical protein
MTVKKFLASLLALALIAGMSMTLIVGCGKGTTKTVSGGGGGTTTTTAH